MKIFEALLDRPPVSGPFERRAFGVGRSESEKGYLVSGVEGEEDVSVFFFVEASLSFFGGDSVFDSGFEPPLEA